MTINPDHIMSNKKPSAVIFDLDGTLVDSARDLTGALNHVLRLANRREIDISQVRNMVGDGAKALIVEGFTATGGLPDQEELDKILDSFLDYYLKNITKDTVIFPDALKVIQKLNEMDIPVGLCTNKAIKLTQRLMEECGLAPYFQAITGGDSFNFRKPDPRHITSTIKMMCADVENAVMVGDSGNDIIPAQEADIPVIAVSFGYTKTPLSELGPDIIINHYEDFFPALEKVMALKN